MRKIFKEIRYFLFWIIKEVRQNNYHSDISYCNYWKMNNPKQEWFYKFLEHRNLLGKGNKITFISSFGYRFVIPFLSDKKVFFSGENLSNSCIEDIHNKFADYCIDKVDLALGFDFIDAKNYLRFPLWIRYLVKPQDSFEDISDRIKKINSFEYRNNKRDKFAALVASHDKGNIRRKMLNELQKLGAIECAGAFNKNTNSLQDDYCDNKIEYLKQFKFNICPENSDNKGYVTEKIFESIMAGCIPLYWGGGGYIENDILNQKCFILFDENNLEQFNQSVNMLLNNESYYLDFIKQSPFKPGAAELIWDKITKLESMLKSLKLNI
ncbi:hypothetical protein KDE13_06135 [Campylobacter sp. faydin G-140]|uniref:glycosyltransferase family 10 domain-containing protein n=1 Tax=Campylobacter anatolicus TaxID=2829105 RepID=UPI001B9CFCBA|nr:glycosyltransferase family 10 [Campylobacter anatolicus]MBR8465928.1 hypothetical protein [Campylobacter anatolicus]